MKLHCKTIFTIFISVLFFSFISCSKNIEGEITGISASTPIDNMKNMVYDGSLEVTLSNGEKIKVECPEELIKDIKGCPNFKTKHGGGFIANVTIQLKEKQKILISSTESGDWKIVEILK